MMTGMKISRRLAALALLAALLLGATLADAVVFNDTPVLAQYPEGMLSGETEDGGTDEANEGPDVPITGTALERASAAALAYIGEGRVTGTEVGDEEGYYEVEITRANGRQVDVHLDQAFTVLGHESD